MEQTVTIRGRTAFLVSLASGEVVPGSAPGVGLYCADTRHLSLLALRLNGLPPVLMGVTALGPSYYAAQLANPSWSLPDGGTIRPQTVSIHRERIFYRELHERLELVNYNSMLVPVTLTWYVAGDFLDIFDIRAYRPRPRGDILSPEIGRDSVSLRYRGLDERSYCTRVQFHPLPDLLLPDVEVDHEALTALPTVELPHSPLSVGDPPTVEAGRSNGGLAVTSVTHQLVLAPHETTTLTLRISASSGEQQARPHRDFGTATRHWQMVESRWERAHAQVTTDNEAFNALLACSQRDVRSLLARSGSGEMLLAGLPWFAVPFGRDSVIAALQTLLLGPDIARGTLRFLARHQGTRVDEWRDEEPGKILHELRNGELARIGQIPHTPYYGTIDATPLFLVLFDEYLMWTDDVALLHELLPAAERAVRWMIDYGDLDGDGYLEYRRRSQRGLYNQAWKDSHDAYLKPDGTLSVQPTASVEVQGYVYDALTRMARLYRRLGREAEASDLDARAMHLRARFHHDFWLEDERYLALALDGEKRALPAVASNPGHCLWSGIVEPSYARWLASRMVGGDLFSGWGIRTLSTASPSYNPMSYHNGSVWPHDNALIAAGLRRYGFDVEALQVIHALIEAAGHFPWQRLPELFCGFPRSGAGGRAPAPYPMSCAPQAWAAGAAFLFVQTILGLQPDAARRAVRLSPVFPDWLSWIELSNLSVCGARIDLRVTRDGVTLHRNAAGLAVVLRERPAAISRT